MLANRVNISENTALYTLQLPSRLDSLTTVENFTDSLKAQYNIGEDVYGNLLTCLSEAVPASYAIVKVIASFLFLPAVRFS